MTVCKVDVYVNLGQRRYDPEDQLPAGSWVYERSLFFSIAGLPIARKPSRCLSQRHGLSALCGRLQPQDAAACAAACCCSAVLALPAPAAAADDAKLKTYGRHLAQECTGCHRLDGIDNGIPSIIGWDADTFVADAEVLPGRRAHQSGHGVGRQSLDDEQIHALAAYYASLPKPPRQPSAASVDRPVSRALDRRRDGSPDSAPDRGLLAQPSSAPPPDRPWRTCRR